MEAYQELEQKFGEWCRMPNTVACSSGTAALHLALEALQLPPGSEVLVPEFTMIACARAVTLAGLKPVFVDCDPKTLLMENDLRPYINESTSAIMMVHIYGRYCDPSNYWLPGWAEPGRIAWIEDCAECPLPYLDKGLFPDAACWSFYKNKIIHGEEGGMIAFRNPQHSGMARHLRCQGFTDDHNFLHIPRGHNYRMANLLAEPILKSLAEWPQNFEARQNVSWLYDELLPSEWRMPPRKAPWIHDIRLQGINTKAVVTKLNQQGIAARLAFKPMSEQPEYFHPRYAALKAYRASREVIYLPIAPEMAEDRIREICEKVKYAAAENALAPIPAG